MEPLASLEDAAFETRLREHGIPVTRAADVRVRTSGRLHGRAERGLAVDLAVSTWAERRRYDAADFPVARSARGQGHKHRDRDHPHQAMRRDDRRRAPRDRRAARPRRGGGRGRRGRRCLHRRHRGGCAGRAARRSFSRTSCCPSTGPRSARAMRCGAPLAATGGTSSAFSTATPPTRILGIFRVLVGPLLTDPSVSLVKGAFDRPLRVGETEMPHEGGRVTELMARPLLNLHEPRLAGFTQPLAGEFAGRRTLLESIPFASGYGVEIATPDRRAAGMRARRTLRVPPRDPPQPAPTAASARRDVLRRARSG